MPQFNGNDVNKSWQSNNTPSGAGICIRLTL